MHITSVEDFIRKYKAVPRETGYEYYFRGHSSKYYSLEPSIYRDDLIENEDKMFKEMIVRTPAEFLNERNTLEKLVKMQHYGLPTRLLDVTLNPLVALYFASKHTNSRTATSDMGEVLMFKIPKSEIKFYDSDTVSILSNLARRPVSFNITGLNKIDNKKFNKQGQIPFLLHEIRDEKPQFLAIIQPKDFNKVLMVKVKWNNSRIIKQDGAFLLFGINNRKNIQADVPKSWIINKSIPKFNLQIPSARKDQVLKTLSDLGVNESTLFPEIQNQAEHIKRQYTPSL